MQPLKDILLAQKECLGNNFMSFYAALAGAIVSFHFEAIQDIQDECPATLCFSKRSGTGKYNDFGKICVLAELHYSTFIDSSYLLCTMFALPTA